MKSPMFALCFTLSISAGLSAQSTPSKVAGRLHTASAVLEQLTATPDKGIPLDILEKAQCVVVVPGFKKGAFLIGAEYGQGVASCRHASSWSAPVFVQLTGASFGFQAGGQSTDLVLIGVSRGSLDDLLRDKVKLGGDVAISAGPVGRNSQAATTELANAEFLTYSRSKGLFAGVDLNGDEVHQNRKDTEQVYGKDVPFKTILDGTVPIPASAQAFVTSLTRSFGKSSAE